MQPHDCARWPEGLGFWFLSQTLNSGVERNKIWEVFGLSSNIKKWGGGFWVTEANIIISRKIDYYKRLVSAVAAASLPNIYKEHGLQDMPKSLFWQSLQPRTPTHGCPGKGSSRWCRTEGSCITGKSLWLKTTQNTFYFTFLIPVESTFSIILVSGVQQFHPSLGAPYDKGTP